MTVHVMSVGGAGGAGVVPGYGSVAGFGGVPGAVPGAGGLYMLNCLNFSQLLFVS